MSRLLRFALPLMLLVAMTGCDAVVDAPNAVAGDARAYPLTGPDSIPVCSTGLYISRLSTDYTYHIESLGGNAEILSESIVNGKRRATVGGVAQGDVQVQVRDKEETVRAFLDVTIAPAQTTGGGQTVCTY